MDDEWSYGHEADQIYRSILEGRPNGMPAWGGRIPAYQIWQIVAYVRSLNNLQPKSAVADRADTIQQNPGTIINRVPGVTK